MEFDSGYTAKTNTVGPLFEPQVGMYYRVRIESGAHVRQRPVHFMPLEELGSLMECISEERSCLICKISMNTDSKLPGMSADEIIAGLVIVRAFYREGEETSEDGSRDINKRVTMSLGLSSKSFKAAVNRSLERLRLKDPEDLFNKADILIHSKRGIRNNNIIVFNFKFIKRRDDGAEITGKYMSSEAMDTIGVIPYKETLIKRFVKFRGIKVAGMEEGETGAKEEERNKINEIPELSLEDIEDILE